MEFNLAAQITAPLVAGLINSLTDNSDSSGDDSTQEEIQNVLLAGMDQLSGTRNLNSRQSVIRTAAVMENRLEQRHVRLDIFRKCAWVDATTFDALVEAFKDQPDFPQRVQ